MRSNPVVQAARRTQKVNNNYLIQKNTKRAGEAATYINIGITGEVGYNARTKNNTDLNTDTDKI